MSPSLGRSRCHFLSASTSLQLCASPSLCLPLSAALLESPLSASLDFRLCWQMAAANFLKRKLSPGESSIAPARPDWRTAEVDEFFAVTYDNHLEFANAMKRFRSQECAVQLAAMRRGIGPYSGSTSSEQQPHLKVCVPLNRRLHLC